MRVLVILMGILSALLITAPIQGLTGDLTRSGPHGGVLLGNEKHQLELSIDSNDSGRSSFNVYVIKSQNQLPDSLGLTILDSSGNRRTVELKALDSGTSAPTQYRGTTGALDPGEQSYAGFEIRIPFSSDAPSILKSN